MYGRASLPCVGFISVKKFRTLTIQSASLYAGLEQRNRNSNPSVYDFFCQFSLLAIIFPWTRLCYQINQYSALLPLHFTVLPCTFYCRIFICGIRTLNLRYTLIILVRLDKESIKFEKLFISHNYYRSLHPVELCEFIDLFIT